MRILSKKTLVQFYQVHSDAKTALEEWHGKTEEAEWENFAQVRNTFNSADAVGNRRIVFNIKGNQYRLVAKVDYRIKTVFIRFFGNT